MSDYGRQALYYVLYGLKGLSIYLVMFCIMNLSSEISFSEFGASYSLFLILLPIVNVGVASLILRYSYSYKNQQNAFFFGFLVQSSVIVVALLIIGSSIKAGLIILWAAFRSAHLSYEAYLISKRYYFHVSSLYLYHIVGALFIAFGVFNNSLTSLNNVLFAFVVLEFIAIPLIGGHISTQSTWAIFRSSVVRWRIYRYVFPVTAISVLMALFLNSDKLIISSLEIFYDQETYFYLFFIILAIHRFLTTPFIMRYSPQYYQASDNVIPARVILIGISMIITSSVLLAAALKVVQPQSYVPTYLFAFSFLVVALYILNLQMLYFKKKRILKVLARNLFAGVISVLFVMIFILKIFGFQYVDVAIVLNAVLMVCIVAQSDQAVSRRYVRILTATAAVFLLVRL